MAYEIVLHRGDIAHSITYCPASLYVVSLKIRIVRILFLCTLPQTDNWCSTTVYRNLQCMSLWINVSSVLREHFTIESFYDWNMWISLWCLSLFLPLYWCFFVVYFLSCTAVWYFMNVFVLPYCVRKLHYKTVQSTNQYITWFSTYFEKSQQ